MADDTEEPAGISFYPLASVPASPRLKFQGSIRTQSTEGVPKVFLVILEVPSCAFLGTQLLTPGGDSLQGSSWTILFLLHFSTFSATP